jgi:uncharacterized membrane protein
MQYSLHFVLALLGAACLAGFFGALLGVGGGVFIVPVMVLMFHLPMRVAVAASIVSVIATSNAGGSSYVEQRITNLKLGMFLEIATTIGALTGSVLAIYLQQWLMLIIFAAMLAYMSYASFTTRNLDDQKIAAGEFAKAKQDWLSRYLELRGWYHDLAANRDVEYIVNGSAIGAGHFLPCGPGVGAAWRGRRSSEGFGDEPLHERADEGGGGHQQADDRRDRGGQFDAIFPGGADSLPRSGTGGAGNNDRRKHRHDGDESLAQLGIEMDFHGVDGLPDVRDVGQSAGDTLRRPAAIAGRMTVAEHSKNKPTASTEENVYVDVYRVLLAGMLISSALFAIGLVRALLHPETYLLTLEWVRSHYHWAATWQGLKVFDAFTLMMVATALLILTPVLRVVISIWAFWVDRDYKYVVVTSTVLAVIGLSVVLAHFGVK